MLFYVIYDKILECYLTDNNGELVRCSTIGDCLDYLEYVVKTTQYDNYCYFLRVIK